MRGACHSQFGTPQADQGSLVQCLAKNYKNYSIVSINMDKVGVMAACCNKNDSIM